MSPFTQFGLAALLATSVFAAPAVKRDVVIVTVTATGPAPTSYPVPAPAPKPVIKAPAPAHPAVPAVGDIKFPSLGNKAGIPFNDGALTNLFVGSKISWAYNWVSSPQGVCKTVEFVPMLHDGTSTFTSVWASEASAALASGSKHLLGFNEPDLAPGTGGTGMSVGDAVSVWKANMEQFHGKATLVSPGVTNGAPPMGLGWLKEFVNACTGCHIDVIALHWYDSCSNVPALKKHLEDAHAQFPNIPMWLSEFGCYGDDGQVSSFLDQALPYLNSQPWIQRYAYFQAAEGKLVSGGALSSYGAKYANF